MVFPYSLEEFATDFISFLSSRFYQNELSPEEIDEVMLDTFSLVDYLDGERFYGLKWECGSFKLTGIGNSNEPVVKVIVGEEPREPAFYLEAKEKGLGDFFPETSDYIGRVFQFGKESYFCYFYFQANVKIDEDRKSLQSFRRELLSTYGARDLMRWNNRNISLLPKWQRKSIERFKSSREISSELLVDLAHRSGSLFDKLLNFFDSNSINDLHNGNYYIGKDRLQIFDFSGTQERSYYKWILLPMPMKS